MKNETFVKITSTGFSSQRYGNCQFCGKPASEMFVKKFYHKYNRPDGSIGVTGANESGPTYGHEMCLKHERE